MKRIGYLVTVLIIAFAFGCGQSNKSGGNEEKSGNNENRREGSRNFNPEEMAKRTSEEMKEALGLSDEQTKQIYDFSIESSKKMSELRKKMQDEGSGMEGMREMFQQMRTESDTKIKAILTDEQKEKYDVWQEERRERRRQQGGGGFGPGGGGN